MDESPHDDLQDMVMRYRAALELEDWPIAELALRAVARTDRDNPSVWFNLGLVLKRLGKTGEAIAAFGDALAIAPAHHNARYELALALYESGALAMARDELERYVKAVPDDTAGLFNLGLVLLRSGDAEPARRMLQRAHADTPSETVTLALAEAERDCGMSDRARLRLQALVSVNPQTRQLADAIIAGTDAHTDG